MGFDALIDNSERSSVVENLKDEINCSICCSIFEDPMKLDCCDGHLCKICFNDVKKKFQNCPLCRKTNFTAKHSRLMVTVLSQLKLLCPAKECKESVAYSSFANHKKTCPALNKKPCPECKKLYWKNDFQEHFECFSKIASANENMKKKEAANLFKIKNFETKKKSFTAKNKELQNKIKTLEQSATVSKEAELKIERQKKEIAMFHEKIKKHQNETTKRLADQKKSFNKESGERKNEINNLKQEIKNLEKRNAQKIDTSDYLNNELTVENWNLTEENEDYKRQLQETKIALERSFFSEERKWGGKDMKISFRFQIAIFALFSLATAKPTRRKSRSRKLNVWDFDYINNFNVVPDRKL
ncbi:Oidioi.mRNA.OKI2018_I69.chr2.g5247.t1.cds [Oikopleura dioica]|uniref:Oidioi.mRNA.OKI2018_I69.chr2.g5247.t1.cds n=1 Tax=Oikopleura dioica TaxID=34765 RepID=A0ABN7SZR5_OIKDI|nr:Oidioi.mRNA.OKI2018_I69.chr2.g5247.t1.cds [Oikopleura dioica]